MTDRAAIERCLAFARDDLGYFKKNPVGNELNRAAFQTYVDAMEFQLREGEKTMDDHKEEVTVREPKGEEQLGWYCVIGPSVTQNHPIKRSWKNSPDAAARHAEKLINDSFNGSRCTTKRLLVVKVVEVVEIAGPPITRRTGSAITADDVGDGNPEDD